MAENNKPDIIEVGFEALDLIEGAILEAENETGSSPRPQITQKAEKRFGNLHAIEYAEHLFKYPGDALAHWFLFLKRPDAHKSVYKWVQTGIDSSNKQSGEFLGKEKIRTEDRREYIRVPESELPEKLKQKPQEKIQTILIGPGDPLIK